MPEHAPKTTKQDPVSSVIALEEETLETHDSIYDVLPTLGSASTPPPLSPNTIIQLQRIIGNRAVQQILYKNRRPNIRSLRFNSSIMRDPGPGSNTLERAIALFAASRTASTDLGGRVLARMRALHSDDEIAYTDLPGDTYGRTHDEFIAGLGVPDIEINQGLSQNVVNTALTLAHETVHHLVGGVYADEELQARQIEIEFYRELQQGIALGSDTFRAGPNTSPDIEVNIRWYDRQQLIDYLLPLYQHDAFISAVWVRTHLNDWGGLSNRWRSSKARYLRVLCESNSLGIFMADILTILESIESQSQFTEIVTLVGRSDYRGGLRLIQIATRWAWQNPLFRPRIERLAAQLSAELRG